jgi:hypothetical protein
MAFALLGVTSPSAVLGVIVGIVILSAAWLHAKAACEVKRAAVLVVDSR